MIDAFEILGALQEARIVMDKAREQSVDMAVRTDRPWHQTAPDYDGAIERVGRALTRLEKAMVALS